WRIGAEARWWTTFFDRGVAALFRDDERFVNLHFTGDATRTWLQDLIARGPFESAAVLGCDDAEYEAAWLAAGASPRLDVYELTPAVIDRVRPKVPGDRVRFVCD